MLLNLPILVALALMDCHMKLFKSYLTTLNSPLLSRVCDPSFLGFLSSVLDTVAILHPIKLLAYADNLPVFLPDPAHLARLHTHLTAYSAAFNARINLHKTQAFSLSGSPLPDCSSTLRGHNITSWHDRTSSLPLRYLSFPMIYSKAQRNSFCSSLLQRIEDRSNFHSSRSLSFWGKATVLTSLILSQLWNGLRRSLCLCASIRRPGSSWVAFFNAVPSLWFFQILFASPSDTLPLRCLQHLVRSPQSPPGFVPCWMSGLPQVSIPSISPRFSLVFPSMKPSGWQDLVSPLNLIVAAINLLRDFYNGVVNLTTRLDLPLSANIIVPAF
ncbi:hypothetical protein PHYBLDRAFT_65574 [Phycomyces blakesleeanus NRRL 1555(-)]|uniref:Reverse transcriptase domain-containing protein n=1 Tax=Phycomyces blakesleeanus (strain ATCC 8743b / DSM 1359 / FGSC 10004 / NBRC 33097 / NRRL 1555) TaxID=763407 RepID=A0A162U004_PHYB8|nr:hypothetical protein PHYBLDRAFT_65574 [Phycomyces blakesleeanus NRRL 1555(-)]OAD72382.1 hypothetical protein PHYBLDRAFT_65574 [Phycomyces blakesleeanus NRRL 1555(-)]|eukprot:XP_018290422.1 hypothetical protein PHYBLDRAFT_65574 [Phycomyces blakesleeanus NRRL 1555(-)]